MKEIDTNMKMYSFPIAAIANYHKFSDLEQNK